MLQITFFFSFYCNIIVLVIYAWRVYSCWCIGNVMYNTITIWHWTARHIGRSSPLPSPPRRNLKVWVKSAFDEMSTLWRRSGDGRDKRGDDGEFSEWKLHFSVAAPLCQLTFHLSTGLPWQHHICLNTHSRNFHLLQKAEFLDVFNYTNLWDDVWLGDRHVPVKHNHAVSCFSGDIIDWVRLCGRHSFGAAH